MGIFGAFTGGNDARAEKTIRQFSGQRRDENIERLRQANQQARDERINATNAAIHSLTGGRDAATNILQSTLAGTRGDIDTGVAQAQGALGGARGALTAAGDSFAPVEGLADRYGGATQLLLDALGAGGAEGGARARDAFENSLQTDFVTEQGFKDLIGARRAAGDGTFGGGNFDRELLEFGQDRARANTGDFLDRLSSFINPELAAATTAASGRAGAQEGIAGTFLTEADLLDRAGRTRAELSRDTGNRIADLTSGTSAAVAGLQDERGSALQQLATALGRDEIALDQRFVDQLSGSLRNQATARNNAGANIVGGGLKLAEILAGLGGSASGSSGSGRAL